LPYNPFWSPYYMLSSSMGHVLAFLVKSRSPMGSGCAAVLILSLLILVVLLIAYHPEIKHPT
jgi:hypothetical protein